MSSAYVDIQTDRGATVSPVTGDLGRSADPAVPNTAISQAKRGSFIEAVPVDEPVKVQVEDLKAIYSEPSEHLSTAMRLVWDSLEGLRAAIEAEEAGDRFKADDSMLRVQSDLPALFGVRIISDGFGVIITGLISAFANKRGSPFAKGEMFAILRAYHQLWSAPFLTAENAIQVTEALDDAGLVLDPTLLTGLFEAAEESGFVGT